MDVCFYEAFEEEAQELRRHLPRDVQAVFTWKTIQESGDADPPAGLISIRTQSVIPVAWAPRLHGILARSTGYDHLARYLAACGHPVPCGYLPLYCHRAVAEQAMLIWMALLRRLPRQLESFASFRRDGLTGLECEGRTLGVVGVGNIGGQVLRIGAGLGMIPLGVDLVERFEDIRYASADEALARADVIVCAMNLTALNTGYFDYRRLSRCRGGAIFVNVARGEMSPPGDLLRLLEEGRLGGVGLDVHDREQELAVALRGGSAPPDPDTPAGASVRATLALARRPDVILTPHNAFNTREAVGRKAEHAMRQVEAFLRDGAFLWAAPDAGVLP